MVILNSLSGLPLTLAGEPLWWPEIQRIDRADDGILALCASGVNGKSPQCLVVGLHFCGKRNKFLRRRGNCNRIKTREPVSAPGHHRRYPKWSAVELYSVRFHGELPDLPRSFAVRGVAIQVEARVALVNRSSPAFLPWRPPRLAAWLSVAPVRPAVEQRRSAS